MGCPTTQFSSGTNYLDLASDSTSLRGQSHRTALTSDISHKWGAHWMQLWGLSWHPHFDNSLEQLTKLRKALLVLLFVYYKGCNSGRAKWKRCTRHDMVGGGHRAPLPLGTSPSWHLNVFTNPEAPQPSGLGGFLEVPFCRHDWLNHWQFVIDNLQLFSFPRRLINGPENSNPPVPWLVLWWPVPTLKLPRGPPGVTSLA